MYYLDTSVLVAYYSPERTSEKTQKTLSRLRHPTISSLVELEFYSALSMKVRADEINAATASQIAAMFQKHISDGRYGIAPLGTREYAIARNWLSGFNSPLRTLDALHLAAAFANDLTLVSADKPLIQAAQQFGVKHLLIA